MHGTFYLSGTLHHAVDNSRSAIRKATVLETTHALFVLARNCVLTKAIVSQEDKSGWGEKFQHFYQLPCIVKQVRGFVKKKENEIETTSYSLTTFFWLLKIQTDATNLFTRSQTILIIFMDSWKEVVWPSRKLRSVGPRKSKLNKTTSKTKKNTKKQKIQECNNTDTQEA